MSSSVTPFRELGLAMASKKKLVVAMASSVVGLWLGRSSPARPFVGLGGAAVLDPAAPPSPPGGTEARRHQPILGLDTAPRPLRLMVCACLDRPWSLLPAEPRVRPLVGHFRLAPQGT